MEFKEDKPTALKEISPLPSSVDISRVEASDRVQSHCFSTSTSLKRIRISTSTNCNAPFVDDASKIALLEPYPEDLESVYSPGPMRTILSSIHALSPQELAHFLSSRPTRLERSWHRYIIKYAICCYCLLSCFMASARVAIGFFHGRVDRKIILGPGGICLHSFCHPR